MTRSEREQIIQRYISGEMSSAEEGDFFVQVALDRELRHDLQAQQMIDSAFRKDREAERSGGHTALRTRVAAMLAASVPPQQPVPEQAPGTPAPTAAAPTAAPAPAALPPAAASAPAAIAPVVGSSITPLGWGALAATAATAMAALVLWNPFASPGRATTAPATDTAGALSHPPATRSTPEIPAATPGTGAPESRERPSAGSPSLPATPAPRNGSAPAPVAVPDRTESRNAGKGARNHSPAVSPADAEDIPESTKAYGKKDGKLDVGVRVRITPKK